MRCSKCNRELEAGTLYCIHCGCEVQIVPDYDPLDDMLAVHEKEEPGKQAVKKEEEALPPSEKPEHMALLRKAAAKFSALSKRQQLGAGLFLLSVLAFSISYGAITSFSHDNSYTYQLEKGMELLEKEKYRRAIPYLERAGELEEPDTELLLAQAEAYAGNGELEEGMSILEQEVWNGTAEKDVYVALIELYMQAGAYDQIQPLIDYCDDAEIQEDLSIYEVYAPVFSLEEGTYHFYQSVRLTATYGDIYYTADGSDPTENGVRYRGPVPLKEGKNEIRAVAVNGMGVVSEEARAVYVIDLDVDLPEDDREY